MSRKTALILAGAGCVIVTGVIVTSINAASSNQIPELGAVASSDNSRPGRAGSYAPLVEKTIPAVVSIYTTRLVAVTPQPFPFGFPFSELFPDRRGPNPFEGEPQEREPGQPNGPTMRQSGLGSGVILSADGNIVTNHHVIDQASEIKVRLPDNRTFTAKLVGSDPRSDIAVLDVEATGLPVLPLGNSSNVKVGDLVLAIGNPFGVGETVTFGMVGAKGRGGLNPESYEDFIQTDASINPGNSGGALINTDGNLVGINTAIISRTGGNQGIGFAVPVNMAHFVIKELISHGKVSRGFIGVGIQDLSQSLAEAFKLSDTAGALITSVEPGSPAEKAGIQRGDVIRQVDDAAVADSQSLRARIGSLSPGSVVKLSLLRNGRTVETTVTLGQLPESGQTTSSTAPQSIDRGAMRGVEVTALTPQLTRQLELPVGAQGVVVSQVDRGSVAFESGLRQGDVIVEVNRTRISSVDEYRRAVANLSGSVLLLINRRGGSLYLALEPRSTGATK